jgi:16S rRNA (uracil1498-N3)-methyltransferase
LAHIHRFFVTTELSRGEVVALEGDDAFHVSRVLRLAAGDMVELADAAGRVYSASITAVDGRVEARAGEMLIPEPSRGELTVAQSIPRAGRMDLIIEKLSELGVASLVPVYSENSVVAEGRLSPRRLQRWRRVARAASGQSRRNYVMEVFEPLSIDDLPARSEGRLVALATETGGEPLGELMEEEVGSLTLLVGPEAGFSGGELRRLRERGAVIATLGGRLLRSETAAIVSATIALHRMGALG